MQALCCLTTRLAAAQVINWENERDVLVFVTSAGDVDQADSGIISSFQK